MNLHERISAFEQFWDGQGPSLILIPHGEVDLYDTVGYAELFAKPERMWESEMRRAEPLIDWPTDGIPTVRPNLGVVFVPSLVGLDYTVQDGQMPWPGQPLSREAILAAKHAELATGRLMHLAAEFYEIHRRRAGDAVACYQADTQGALDIAHLLWGDNLFYELPDPECREWVQTLLDTGLELHVAATRHLKGLVGESAGRMIHGHGAPQGVFFPTAGGRICEDTATLLSPQMLGDWILPRVQRMAEELGGVFAHFCGYHRGLLERLCQCPGVRAIDLGNPEKYDSGDVLGTCAQSGTVLCSRLAGLPGETWQAYVRRLALLVKETGARCILRATVYPTERSDCAAMRDLWHELTQ